MNKCWKNISSVKGYVCILIYVFNVWFGLFEGFFELICVWIVVVLFNGLVIYCGIIVIDEGKEKKVNIDFELFRFINIFLYLCDNKFYIEVRFILLDFIRLVWG